MSGSQKPWNKYLEQCLHSGTAAGPLPLFSHSTQSYQQELSPPTPPKLANKAIKPLPQESVCLSRAKTTNPNPTPLKCPGYPSATQPPLPQSLQNWWTGKKSLLPYQIKMEKEEKRVSKNLTSPHPSTVSSSTKLHRRLRGYSWKIGNGQP